MDFQDLLNADIVVDLSSQYVVSGKLVSMGEHFLCLEQADVHDLRDTNTSRDLYVVEIRRLGIRPNRDRVWVRLAEIVAVCRLTDITL